jgi:acyl-CoA reductase-like NAD-dependent aldehyde dehydrogenase
MSSISLPSGPPDTSLDQVDYLVNHLRHQHQAWLKVDRSHRCDLLEACIQGVLTVASAWVTAGCQAKGIDPQTALAGEEWLVGPATTVLYLQQLKQTLRQPNSDQAVQLALQDSAIVRVFPDSFADRLMWLGFRGEVWLQPTSSIADPTASASAPDRVALVLGAGNVAATGILDALYQLFAANRVVILKMNPVNAYLGEFWATAFAPLCQAGWLAIVYGGADLGDYLCQHKQVDAVHITGSHRTHNAIVWGHPTDPSVSQSPRLTKPISSELGSVTPVFVVPGDWSAAEMAVQAHHVASMMTNNASFNCVAAKVVVTATGWPQRQAFLDRLHQELAHIPPRLAYYPGALAQYQAVCQRYRVQVWGQESATVNIPTIPWTTIPDVPPIAGEYALTEEIFCNVMAEVSLPATTAAEFLPQAVEFANTIVWGSLSCVILIDPRTQQQVKSRLTTAIAQLRYGAIGINVWTGVMYCLGIFPWGAYPGNPLHDIGSGQGFVHNAKLFEQPQKSVLYAPFRIFPKPIWFANHRTADRLGQQLTDYYAAPSLGKFLAVVWAAMRG